MVAGAAQNSVWAAKLPSEASQLQSLGCYACTAIGNRKSYFKGTSSLPTLHCSNGNGDIPAVTIHGTHLTKCFSEKLSSLSVCPFGASLTTRMNHDLISYPRWKCVVGAASGWALREDLFPSVPWASCDFGPASKVPSLVTHHYLCLNTKIQKAGSRRIQ